jgi:hypothetical protein
MTFGNLEHYIRVYSIVYLLFGIRRQIKTLVISTHGFIKKRSKVPDSEIQRATQIRTKYFEEKQSKDRNK